MTRERGQGLVEMAIATPVLIFILLGLFEVGFALRSYYILANANRETARFAVRTDYLDFDAASQAGVGYDKVIEHAYTALGGLGDDFAENGVILVSYVSVTAGFPCDPAKRGQPTGSDDWPNCDCEAAVTHPFSPTVIITPHSGPRYSYRYPATSGLTSRIPLAPLVDSLQQTNIRVNCQRQKWGALPFEQHEVIIVEFFYAHRQLFGVPILSNPFTDPIPMYAHTIMRILPSRDDKK